MKDLGGMQGDDGEAKQNWYDTLMENLTTELDKLIELCAQNVMYPPPRGHGMHQKYNQAEAKAAWKLQMSSVKSLVTKIRQDGDNNEADQVSSIMKVLKIKDDILAQTFAAMTYKKTLKPLFLCVVELLKTFF